MRSKYTDFPVGGCAELTFTQGTVGNVFDHRKNGETGTVKKGYFVPFFSLFSPILIPFSLTTPCHSPPQPTSCLLFPRYPPPPHRPFLHIPPHFSPFPPIFPISPIFQTPKSWFGELMSAQLTAVGGNERPLVVNRRRLAGNRRKFPMGLRTVEVQVYGISVGFLRWFCFALRKVLPRPACLDVVRCNALE